jgi:hypothetical protein
MSMTQTEGTKTVGRFSFDYATGTVSGPADYMRKQGNARLRSIEQGQDVVVKMGYQLAQDRGESPDIITLILVSLQTDFAAYLGALTLGRDGRS